MKEVKILKNGIQSHGAKFQDDQEMQLWIDECILKNKWGKPEHWVYEHELNGQEPIESKEEVDDMGIVFKKYKLPCEYEIKIIDLELDPVYKLNEILSKRKKEYPAIDEVVGALMDSGLINFELYLELKSLQEKRLLIKEKYPKS